MAKPLLRDRAAKDLLRQIDNYYAQFLTTRKLKEQKFIDGRSHGEQRGENMLKNSLLSLEKNYYPGSIFELIIKHLVATNPDKLATQAKKLFTRSKFLQEKYQRRGWEGYWMDVKKCESSTCVLAMQYLGSVFSGSEQEKIAWAPYLGQDMVNKIIDQLGIEQNKFKRLLQQAQYKPLDITYRINMHLAEKELVQELTADGSVIDWDENTKAYIIEQAESNSESNPEKVETHFLTEEKILDKLEEYLEQGVGIYYVAIGLAGDYTTFVWRLYKKQEKTVTHYTIKSNVDKEFDAQQLVKDIKQYLQQDSHLANKHKQNLRQDLVDTLQNGKSFVQTINESLHQYEDIREEKVEQLKTEAAEQLDEVMKILDGHDIESIRGLTNGKLESVLNAVLRYEVK